MQGVKNGAVIHGVASVLVLAYGLIYGSWSALLRVPYTLFR